jgi:transposase
MRKGIDGLTMLVQGVLHQDPFTGHLFVFRGRTRANLIKIIYWDGTGLCPFTKRLEHGVFLWPPSVEPGETLSLTSAQLSSLINGVDWRAPEQHQICARLRIFHEPYNRSPHHSRASAPISQRGWTSRDCDPGANPDPRSSVACWHRPQSGWHREQSLHHQAGRPRCAPPSNLFISKGITTG